jgi:hypothetical protein
MSKYRTLKLTHEQIELLIQALGIAERKFIDIHKDIQETTVRVRRNHAVSSEQSNRALYYHDLACKMADMNIDLQNGELDV